MVDVFRVTPTQEEMRRMWKLTEMVLAADPGMKMLAGGHLPALTLTIKIAKQVADHDAASRALVESCFQRPKSPVSAEPTQIVAHLDDESCEKIAALVAENLRSAQQDADFEPPAPAKKGAGRLN